MQDSGQRFACRSHSVNISSLVDFLKIKYTTHRPSNYLRRGISYVRPEDGHRDFCTVPEIECKVNIFCGEEPQVSTIHKGVLDSFLNGRITELIYSLSFLSDKTRS